MNLIENFTTELAIENFDEELLENNKKLMLYRIVQEQVNNIVKYSKAKKVLITLKFIGEKLILNIEDNGVGFDTTLKPKGIGLKNIESRVSYYSGSVQLTSFPDKGTSLQVLLPM